MKKVVLLFVLVLIVAGLPSCSSQYPMLYQKAAIGADEYKNGCKGKGLQSAIIAKADSLHTTSVELMHNGKEQEGYYLMELATIHYRLALSQNEITVSKEEVKKLEQSLVKAQDKLDTYKKVLNEIESIKQ